MAITTIRYLPTFKGNYSLVVRADETAKSYEWNLFDSDARAVGKGDGVSARNALDNGLKCMTNLGVAVFGGLRPPVPTGIRGRK